MASVGWTTMRLVWNQVTPPWLCDGLVLGAAVATISSTCALAFASALMRVNNDNNNNPNMMMVSKVVVSQFYYNACPECNALRLFNNNNNNRLPNSAAGYSSTLLEFSMDSLLTETVMSFTISFIIVTFALFLVREMR